MASSDDLAGQAGLTAANSPAHIHDLRSGDSADKRRGLMPVKIVAIHGGGLDGMATADVQPLVHQVDGLGRPTPHGTVYGVAVGRQHSGSGAFISDPVIGDVYAMIPADRDMSKVKASGGQASAPDSKRRSSLADGVLSHALIAGKPTQGMFCKPGGGVKVFDKGGAVIETSADGKKVTINNASGATVVIKDGMTYVGGDPDKGGSFDFLMIASGPCTNAKGKTG